MSRARRESLEALKNWVLGRSSQVTKLASGQGIAGTRAAPSQSGSNDMTIGSRLDNGEKVTKDGKEYKRYKWQINKNAQNATLKELANKDTKNGQKEDKYWGFDPVLRSEERCCESELKLIVALRPVVWKATRVRKSELTIKLSRLLLHAINKNRHDQNLKVIYNPQQS
ncbi:hypothetical protein BJX66DRAFT_343215 [Aspergillus keveii]|uniref:Uncharacterized protein n=1 Tax=Aspergillus keveii TaxID=714993 RepID=A0ABR4FQM2_9EURO